jgi:hypothetical protein
MMPEEGSDLADELARLERDEVKISALRRTLHVWLDHRHRDLPANELLVKRERAVSDQRRALHRRIAILRDQLARANRRRAA